MMHLLMGSLIFTGYSVLLLMLKRFKLHMVYVTNMSHTYINIGMESISVDSIVNSIGFLNMFIQKVSSHTV